MHLRRFWSFLIVCAFVFSFTVCSLAVAKENPVKKELMGQLDQARKDFMVERDKLHDQIRVMRIAWHTERASLCAQAKQNPKDKAIKAAINEGAKKYYADRKNVYNQLVELRNDWLNTRKELGDKIKNVK